MLKKISTLLCTFLSILSVCSAQVDSNAVLSETLHSTDNLKTGNYTDVLTNFFQLAVSDLTTEDRTFEFKSTLFAIKAKANPDLLIDKNYLKEYVSRNLQFNFSLGVNQDYKLSSYSAGLTYAIVNKRDRTVATFMGSEVDVLLKAFAAELSSKTAEYLESLPDSLRGEAITNIQSGIDFFEQTNSLEKIPEDYLRFSNIDFTNTKTAIHNGLEELYAAVDQKPLLTISANAKSDSSTATFDSGDLEMVFLQGSNPEADLRAKLHVKDTLYLAKEWRANFNFKGSINFVIAQDHKSGKSLIEAKIQGEYNHIFKGLQPDEDRDQVMANAEFRLRITDDFWIPLTLKYDLLNPNFYGFLNIALNLGALGKSLYN